MMRAAKLAIASITLVLSVSVTAQDGLSIGLPVVSPVPPASVKDPISPAIRGLVAQIEVQNGDGDAKLMRAITKGCQTQLIGKRRRWTIDWRAVTALGPGDTFVYVWAPGLQLSVVGQVWKPKQARKLADLLAAMQSMQLRCMSD